MLELVEFRVEFWVIASKTLSWDIIRIELAYFFVVKLKPVVLAIHALTLFNETVIVTTFSCALVHYNAS